MGQIEANTRYVIDAILENKGWKLSQSPEQNVFFETDILNHLKDEKISKKLNKSRLRPDYVLCDDNKKPIAVIEAKAGGKNLEKAIEQANEYAEILETPLIFAMNNSYCLTKHLDKKEPLYINEREVNELIGIKEAEKFIIEGTNKIYTIPQKYILSRQELITIFKNLNNTLKGEGLQAGMERLTEFSNFLFLKLYTENTNTKLWNDIKNVSNQSLIDTINSSLKKIQQNYNTDIFSDIKIRNCDTIREIINRLDQLHLSSIDSDIKGDAFEYFLQNSSSNSGLGEYFTPRHIVKAMVNLVNPKFNEKVYDPFCGTGGFLTESYNHIRDNTVLTDNDRKTLTNDTIFGGEITTTARLAKMNMILHGDGHNGVNKVDSLENPKAKEFKVVITNIPFSLSIVLNSYDIVTKKTKKITKYTNYYENGLAKNNGDAVCMLHCFKAVDDGGRIALIVPEGVLFKNELKHLRKFFMDHTKLQAVISLPQGVFLPYTGIKTNILYFTECHTGTTDKVWFYEVKNDGFTLNNHRKPIKENDLKVIDYINFNKKGQEEDWRSMGFVDVDVDEIKNNDYSWIVSGYVNKRKNVKSGDYDIVPLSDVVLDIKDGGTPPRKSKDNQEYFGGNINWCVVKDIKPEIYETREKLTEIGLKNCSAKVWPIDSIIISLGATIGNVGIAKIPTATKQGLSGMIVDNKKILPKYLYYILNYKKEDINNMATGATIKEVRPNRFIKNFFIPLPPLEIQQEIVNKLDKIQESINATETLIKNLKDEMQGGGGVESCPLCGNNEDGGVNGNNEWQEVELKDIAIITLGQSPESEFYNTNKNGLPFYQGKMEFGDIYIKKPRVWTTKLTKEAINGDILMSVRAPVGDVNMCNIEKICIGRGLSSVRVTNKVNNWFLFYYLNSIKNKIIGNQGSVFTSINKQDLEKIKIPLPPIEIQQRIVDKLDKKQAKIEMLEELLDELKLGGGGCKSYGNEVKLEEIINYEQPTKYIVNDTNYSDEYKTPVLTAGKNFILGYTNETDGIFSENLPVIIFDDFTCDIKYVDFPFKVKSSAMKILHVDKNKANVKFIHYMMKNIKINVDTHKRYWISEYSKIKINIPVLKEQNRIVSEIEEYENFIDKCLDMVEKFKNKFHEIIKMM
jgi:type I restriction enzyme M protein